MHLSTSLSDKYYELYDKLVELYYNSFECRLKLSLLCLLLILRNGLRATESIMAVEEFLKSNERVIIVKALKGGNYRYVVFPEEISLLDLFSLKQCFDTMNRFVIKNTSYSKLKTNPHALRSLYIKTLYYENKASIEKIKTIVGHRDKKNTERYINRVKQ